MGTPMERPSPKVGRHTSTQLQWHPAMAPRPLPQSWSSPSPNHSTLQWHPAMAPRPLPQSWSPCPPNHTMAPGNGTTSTPSKLVVTLLPPTIAHYNGTQQMAPRPLPQSWSSPSPPTIAHYNGTLQWHPAMAPRPLPKVGRHPIPPNHSTVHNGTLRWHPAMAPRPLHPAMSTPGATSNPPKWFVAIPPIGSKNPYSYRYLGKKQLHVIQAFRPEQRGPRRWSPWCGRNWVPQHPSLGFSLGARAIGEKKNQSFGRRLIYFWVANEKMDGKIPWDFPSTTQLGSLFQV